MVQTVATGKKAITGTYNLLGKVVGSAAGVVGAKEVVGSGFQGVKKAFGKSGLMSSVVSIFGEVDLLDDLRDHWTHESKVGADVLGIIAYGLVLTTGVVGS